MNEQKEFDVIIVGGSYAGLSAAMALGRSLRSVLIIDGGQPCNRQTPHSHNFLTQDGQRPDLIASKGKKEVLNYKTVRFISDFAISGTKNNAGFTIVTTANGDFYAKKLVFATGIKDAMPNIKGFSECWGISVIHCPYCHGYEFRDRPTIILANGERALHLASLVNNLTANLTIITSGKPDFKPEQTEKLRKHNIKIIDSAVIEIEHKDGHLQHLLLTNGQEIEAAAMYAAIPFTQHSNIPVALGCQLDENGYIKIDSFQKTGVDGIYACGDNSNRMRAVANAVYSGNITGAMINKELTDDVF